MGKRTKRIVGGLAASLVLVIGALVVAPAFIPVEVYRQQIIEQGEKATGRSIRVGGDVHLRFFPNVQLTLQDVHLSNPKDFGAKAKEDMLSLKELQLSLGLFDLLSGIITIHRFELIDPVIALEKNTAGKANWEFDSAEAPKPAADAKSSDSSQSFIQQLQLPALTITNGTFSYTEPKAEPISLSKLNVKLEAPGLNSPAELTFDTTFGKDVPVKGKAKLSTPKRLMDGEEVELAVDASLGNTDVSFNGKAQQPKEGALSANGAVKLASASLKALGKQLGTTILPDSLKGEGKLAFAGNLSYADPKVEVQDIALSLDQLNLKGFATANLGGDRPSITADLASADVLVVADLLAPAESSAATASAPAQPASSGWSKEPVLADTSFLKAANADVKLSVGGLKYDTITAGAMSLHTVLKQGNLSLNIPDFDFYEGKANFALTLAAPAKSANITQKATLADINVGKFIEASQGEKKLEGKGTVELSTRTSGVSVHDFVSNLNGNGSLKMRDGAIKGINIAETVRNARNLLNAGGKGTEANTGSKTDFSELTATFTITQGLVSNEDLSMKAPLLTLTGAGKVDLPPQRVDYRLRPTLVATIEGQDRTAEASRALTVPLRVTGTFDKLSFAPDATDLIQDVLKDPAAAKDTLKNTVKDVKSLFDGFKKPKAQ